MNDRLEMLLEAERRGILPPDKVQMLTEARSRGLVGGAPEMPPANVAGNAPAGPQEPAYGPAEKVRDMMSVMSPLGRYAPDILMGLRQPLDAVAQLTARMTGLGGESAEGANQKAWDAYQKTWNPEGTPGAGLVRGLAQSGPMAPLVPAMRVGDGLMKALGKGGISGAVGGALTPVYGANDDREFWGKKLDQVKEGAGFGTVGAGVVRAGARALSPVVNEKARFLRDEGVMLTPGMTGGKIAHGVEDKVQSMPIVGDAITSARFETLESFNKVLYGRTLRRFGEKAEAYGRSLPAGSEGIRKVGDALSDLYDDTLARTLPSKLDPSVVNAMSSLQAKLPRSVRDDFADVVKSEVFDRVTPAGTITSDAFKRAESELGRMYRTYKGSGEGDKRLLADAFHQAQAELRSLVAKYNPREAARLREINAAWADLVQLETAGARIGSKEGLVTPAAYRSAVKATDASRRDRAFARGEARNQTFADAAESVIPSKYPDSGTFGRMALGVGAAGMLPLEAVAGLSAASVPYLPGIRRGMVARPEVLDRAGAGMRSLAPYASLPFLSGLLGNP